MRMKDEFLEVKPAPGVTAAEVAAALNSGHWTITDRGELASAARRVLGVVADQEEDSEDTGWYAREDDL
jgi:hypothetical protein